MLQSTIVSDKTARLFNYSIRRAKSKHGKTLQSTIVSDKTARLFNYSI